MTRLLLGISLTVALIMGTGCKRDPVGDKEPSASEKQPHDDHEHHVDDGHDHAEHGEHDDHGHGHGNEADLGTFAIDDMKISVVQGHGKVEPGMESHLVVKLPYDDEGATVVRAWVGTKDRTRSFVGKGEYATSRKEYSIHAIAPKPLPANVMWWIEIERPDGTIALGSVRPLLD